MQATEGTSRITAGNGPTIVRRVSWPSRRGRSPGNASGPAVSPIPVLTPPAALLPAKRASSEQPKAPASGRYTSPNPLTPETKEATDEANDGSFMFTARPVGRAWLLRA
jgi:hypothetical protein